MLADDVERYLSLRRALGYELRDVAINLRSYARFADSRRDIHIHTATVHAWATNAVSQSSRHRRFQHVIQLARFLHAEDPEHEVPINPSHFRKHRKPPYIYTEEEIAQLIGAAYCLRESYPLQRRVYATLIGLIAATGLRNSEARSLRMDDVLPGGILHIRRTKFGKSRLVPMHPTVAEELKCYMEARRKLPVADDHLFLSFGNKRLSSNTVTGTFRRLCQHAGIVLSGKRQPRIHDLRHTLATRVLERCAMNRDVIARHFVALATYLGHAHMRYTYWYLEATPELLGDIASAAEMLIADEQT